MKVLTWCDVFNEKRERVVSNYREDLHGRAYRIYRIYHDLASTAHNNYEPQKDGDLLYTRLSDTIYFPIKGVDYEPE